MGAVGSAGQPQWLEIASPDSARELQSEWFSRTLWILATAKAGYWKWGWNTVVGSHTCPNPGAELTKSFWKFGALSSSTAG